jgi:uncharacterized protein YndB with AHSA1/START domain
MAPPVATAGMLIRRPVDEVFEAFADPAVTTRFWFSEGSGRLEPGAEVRWTWAMYGFATDVLVKRIDPGRRILIDWDVSGTPTEVEWTFEPRGNHSFVEVARALDSAGGFALVLAGAKIWLEHGIEPRFVLDRHPDALLPGWKAE